jgi:uncharacterized protein YcfJ
MCPESEQRYLGQVATGAAGAGLGVALGNQVGGGSGKDAARVILGAVGAYVGSQHVGKQIDAKAMNAEQQEMAARTGCRPNTYGNN